MSETQHKMITTIIDKNSPDFEAYCLRDDQIFEDMRNQFIAFCESNGIDVPEINKARPSPRHKREYIKIDGVPEMETRADFRKVVMFFSNAYMRGTIETDIALHYMKSMTRIERMFRKAHKRQIQALDDFYRLELYGPMICPPKRADLEALAEVVARALASSELG